MRNLLFEDTLEFCLLANAAEVLTSYKGQVYMH